MFDGSEESDKHLTSSGSCLGSVGRERAGNVGGERDYGVNWNCEVEPELPLVALSVFV